MKYPCPCCGYHTLPVPSNEALAYICPVCFWEIDLFIQSDDEPSDQNHGMTLNEAKKNFNLFGACCRQMLGNVRRPLEDEIPRTSYDITFKTPLGRFNYRVCAVIIDGGRILAMQDDYSPYYYLPGGRVSMHETAEDAVLREVREELEIDARIVRPLWLAQSFFEEDASHERFHELCLYYLVDVRDKLTAHGNCFVLHEDGRKRHAFRWLTFAEAREAYLYPNFIKPRLGTLPESLEIVTEIE